MLSAAPPFAWLWLAECDATQTDTAAAVASLGETERRRYAAFQRPQRQRQFLLGRSLLRRMLSQRFGTPIEYWQFTERAGQAPRLDSATASPISFSIAHSQQYVACLLGSAARVGCDIEHLGRARNYLAVADHYFTQDEAQQIAAAPEPQRAALFYRRWAQHEATYKAACSQQVYSALWNGYCVAVSLPDEIPPETYLARLNNVQMALTPLSLPWETMRHPTPLTTA